MSNLTTVAQLIGHLTADPENMKIVGWAYMYIHTYVRKSSTKNGFFSISFEKISVLDSYFIHRYIIIK